MKTGGSLDIGTLSDASTMSSYNNEDGMEFNKPLKDFTEEDVKPLIFHDLESAEQFYYLYAKAKGFGVRKRPVRVNKRSKAPTSRIYLCHAEGLRSENWLPEDDKKRNSKPITRCECKAEIQFKRVDNHWIVARFNPDHTHELVGPNYVHYLRAFRRVSNADKTTINDMYKSGINPSLIMRCAVHIAGGHQNVGYMKRDLYNELDKSKRSEVEECGSDAETVMAYLNGKQTHDPAFFVRFTRNNNGQLENLFWCDGTSRIDYLYFGHLLIFDTTYKTNKYGMPLLVLVGINHHRRTIIFGYALLGNETQESFSWVLQQLIESGDGKKPSSIMTDGDKAMANAIAFTIPEARHRLCLWHLMRNVNANGGTSFVDGIKKCIFRCNTSEDFDKAWEELVKRHGVEDRKWVTELYADREKWSEAFHKNQFFGGIRSTQRCESMHNRIKGTLRSKMQLYAFVQACDKVLAEMRFQEGQDDFITLHTSPKITGSLKAVKSHAAKIYTRNSYKVLCEEIEYEGMFLVEEEVPLGGVDNDIVGYVLQHVDYKDEKYHVKRHGREGMRCSCLKFESYGFPCRHMFAVMKKAGIKEIPSACIVVRWTRDAKPIENAIEVEEKDDDHSIILSRYAHLFARANEVCFYASKTHERFNDCKNKLVAMRSAYVDDEQKNQKKRVCPEMKRSFGLDDPPPTTTKGAPKKQCNSKCGNCGRRGHTKRKCLHKTDSNLSSNDDKNNIMSQVDKDLNDIDWRPDESW